MSNQSPHVQQIRVESQTLPIRERVEQTSARGDIKVSPCGGIIISLSLDRPNESVTISAKDIRDDNADFVYKKEGGTYDKTTTYGPFPEGTEVFYVKERNKNCIFKVTKEVIHCDISLTVEGVIDEEYDKQDGKITVSVSTPSDSVEWAFDGGAWYSGSKTQTWKNLNQGTYIVEARDEWGCKTSVSVTVDNIKDTYAPSIPQNITIQDAADGESALLDWDDSTDDELSVDHYNVYRSTTQGFTIGSTNRIGQPTTSDFEDTTVADGTTYYYKITAVDSSDQANESSPSTEKKFTFSDDVDPQTPSNLSGSVSDNTVRLDWDASSSPDIDHYNVYQDTVKVTESTGTTKDIAGLTNGQSYDFYVTAVDEAGNESPTSNTITKTPQDKTPPADPTGLVASYNASGPETSLSWNQNTDSDFDHYDVFRSTSSGGPYTQINSSDLVNESYTDSTISRGTTYYYVVRATDDDGLNSGYSNEVSITAVTDIREDFEDYSLGDTISDFKSQSIYTWNIIDTGWYLDDVFTGDGSISLRTNDIGNNQSTEAEFEYDLGKRRHFILDWTQDSEGYGYDMTDFFIDGNNVKTRGGENNRKIDVFEVDSGVRVFRLKYRKDSSNSVGEDTVFIHDVELTTVVPAEFDNPSFFNANPKIVVLGNNRIKIKHQYTKDTGSSLISGYNAYLNGSLKKSGLAIGSSTIIGGVPTNSDEVVELANVRASDGVVQPTMTKRTINVPSLKTEIEDWSGYSIGETFDIPGVIQGYGPSASERPTIQSRGSITGNALRSENNGTHSSESGIRFQFYTESNRTLEGEYEVSSENNFDYFKVRVNGSVAFSQSSKASGTFSVSLTGGQVNNVEIFYAKDGSVSKNADRAWWGNLQIV